MPVLHPPPGSTHIRPLTPDPSPLTLTDTPPGTRLGEVRGACLRPLLSQLPLRGPRKGHLLRKPVPAPGTRAGVPGLQPGLCHSHTRGHRVRSPGPRFPRLCSVGSDRGGSGDRRTRCHKVRRRGLRPRSVGRLLLLHHRPPNASPCASRSGPSTSSPGSFSEAPAPPAPPCLQASPGKGAQKGQRALHGACLQSTHPAPRPCQPPVPRQAFSLG